MSYTVHNIELGIHENTGRSNLKGIIEQIMGNLVSNLTNNQEDFIEFATKQTEYIAKLETKKFAFKGNLERGIAHRIFKKAKRGEVFIKSDQVKKAIMNEFGQRPILKVLNAGVMEDWVRAKAPHLINKEIITVGDSGGNVHAPNPKNRFWGKTQEIVKKDIDNMFAHYLEKAIEKS